jgi:hypothetical protein
MEVERPKFFAVLRLWTEERPAVSWMESLQFRSRNEPPAQNDRRHTARVGDVCQRVRLEQDQVRLLACFNRAFVSKAPGEFSGVPG